MITKFITRPILIAAMSIAPYALFAQTNPYKIEVGDFSELKVSDNINVEYRCSTDSAGWAYFDTDPQTVNMIMFTNKNNKLNIQVDADGKQLTGLPVIRVYSLTLQKAENSGDSLLSVLRTLPVRDFSATVVGNGSIYVSDIKTHVAKIAVRTGNGHVVVNGTTRQANLQNVGTGKVEASGLQAQEVKCNILGTGPIDCNASVSLTVTGAGSGKVYYGGSPSKISNRSIGVKAISVDSDQVID